MDRHVLRHGRDSGDENVATVVSLIHLMSPQRPVLTPTPLTYQIVSPDSFPVRFFFSMAKALAIH